MLLELLISAGIALGIVGYVFGLYCWDTLGKGDGRGILIFILSAAFLVCFFLIYKARQASAAEAVMPIHAAIISYEDWKAIDAGNMTIDEALNNIEPSGIEYTSSGYLEDGSFWVDPAVNTLDAPEGTVVWSPWTPQKPE